MCDYFNDFDGEFMDDDFEDYPDDGMDDYGMEDAADPDINADLNHEDDQCDTFGWDEAYWIGTGIGYAYEEGRRGRRKQKNSDSGDPSGID